METRVGEKSCNSRFKQRIREWLESKPVGQAFQPAIHYPELRHFNREDVAAVSFHRRRLPHWQLEGSTYFVILNHSVRNEADWLDKFDYIHNNPAEAGLVARPQDYPYSSLVTLYSVGRLESLPHRLNSRPRQRSVDSSRAP